MAAYYLSNFTMSTCLFESSFWAHFASSPPVYNWFSDVTWLNWITINFEFRNAFLEQFSCLNHFGVFCWLMSFYFVWSGDSKIVLECMCWFSKPSHNYQLKAIVLYFNIQIRSGLGRLFLFDRKFSSWVQTPRHFLLTILYILTQFPFKATDLFNVF